LLSVVIGYLGVVFGVAGALCVAVDRCFCANCIWLLGNLLLIVDAIVFDNYKSIFMFAVYEIVSLVGVVRYLKINNRFPF
jgi:hypothetical protein